MPSDLRKALTTYPQTAVMWKDLTPIGRRDFLSWIESAKQPETRKRRIESLGSRMASGKRRPCCFAVVPMSLYKALGAHPKAKTQWSALTASEKRDFVDWINAVKDSAEQGLRIDKACVMIAAGRKHP